VTHATCLGRYIASKSRRLKSKATGAPFRSWFHTGCRGCLGLDRPREGLKKDRHGSRIKGFSIHWFNKKNEKVGVMKMKHLVNNQALGLKNSSKIYFYRAALAVSTLELVVLWHVLVLSQE